jgi:peptide chain release factor 1
MNSARLRHLPTGLVVTSQHRKRPNSETEARTEMTARLDALLAAEGAGAENADRSAQIGCGARADKRRTYRFQDGVVTDHETGKSVPCKKVMKGMFDLLW